MCRRGETQQTQRSDLERQQAGGGAAVLEVQRGAGVEALQLCKATGGSPQRQPMGQHTGGPGRGCWVCDRICYHPLPLLSSWEPLEPGASHLGQDGEQGPRWAPGRSVG